MWRRAICAKPDETSQATYLFGAGAVLNSKLILGDLAHGRDNNFNLIRFGAAVAVLVSHAWPVSQGRNSVEPLVASLGHSLGGLAVYAFFALSGFFIASSFDRSRSSFAFVSARATRLFPGLAVSLVFVAFVMGPLVTKFPLVAYLSDPETTQFLLRNLALIDPQYTLPGVFEDLPYPTVEGSIWTLVHEVACYGLVLLLGVSGLLTRYSTPVSALAIYGAIWIAPFEMHPKLIQLQALSLPFVAGACLWLWRDRVVLSVPLLVILPIAAGMTRDTVFAYPTLIFALTYCVFWFGYVPAGRIRLFNRLGDYSYGIYIYAFPFQGFAVWLWGSQSPAVNILLSLPMVLISAVASWHWIERPALARVLAGLAVRHKPKQQC